MTDRKPRVRSKLDRTEAARALHLDFEGFAKGPPVFAGIRVDDGWSATVFGDVAPGLVPAADAKGLVVANLDAFLRETVDRAVTEHRVVTGFSMREFQVFEERGVFPEDLRPRFVNLLPLARRWRREVHPDADSRVQVARSRRRRTGRWVGGHGNTLLDFARLLSAPSPVSYGRGCTTSRLRHVMTQVERRGDFSRLTPTAKRKWTHVLRHNEADCLWSSLLAEAAASGDSGAEVGR
ncbi:MAG: hypothetical protein CMJ52_07210 [Planctomycetaceae bacterium]|nr:hypothetical protein [Planctomycetaceae bacterium]